MFLVILICLIYLMGQYMTRIMEVKEEKEFKLENTWTQGLNFLYEREVTNNFGEVKLTEAHDNIVEEVRKAGETEWVEIIDCVNRGETVIENSLVIVGQNEDKLKEHEILVSVQMSSANKQKVIDEIIEDEETPKGIVSNGLTYERMSEQLSDSLTYYDTLTAKEINMLEVVVQHEVGNLSKKYKTLVAELLYNRLKSEDYPSDVQEMLFQEGQFQGIEEWYSPWFEVDAETKEVIKEVFSKENTSHDATAYYNPELSTQEGINWFEYSGDVTFLFEYEEESWGTVYRTRFFK